jgi:hypothetical protein
MNAQAVNNLVFIGGLPFLIPGPFFMINAWTVASTAAPEWPASGGFSDKPRGAPFGLRLS